MTQLYSSMREFQRCKNEKSSFKTHEVIEMQKKNNATDNTLMKQ